MDIHRQKVRVIKHFFAYGSIVYSGVNIDMDSDGLADVIYVHFDHISVAVHNIYGIVNGKIFLFDGFSVC